MNKFLNKYKDLEERYTKYDERKIPLCAAETYVSDFVREPLNSIFEGRYCMNNLNYDIKNDFVGSQYINELFKLLTETCTEIFNAKYTDARTLSGMNCVSITMASMFKQGDNVLLATSKQGGHASVPLLLKTYGINFEEIPYDYEKKDIDYEKLNELLKTKNYQGIVIPQSDLLQPADISKMNIKNEIVVYDATQTLGFIASGLHKNPLSDHSNVILIGGTHKTIPGPTSGIIMTNNDSYIEILDNKISPSYLRNVQPNNIASVLLALIEQQEIGKIYQSKTIENANFLAEKLEKKGFDIGKISNRVYTKTHQVFIYTTRESMNLMYENAISWGISLNKKEKPLFNGFGIRLGLQEVTRYNWSRSDFDRLSEILYEISLDKPNHSLLKEHIDYLSKKKINGFVFNDILTK